MMPNLAPHPRPLATCPGRPAWERFRGEEWRVFMDESFFMFFELTAKTGYFCHAAVGVPESEYAALKAALVPIFSEFSRLVGQRVVEFKHSDFKRLEYRDRRRLALRLRDALVVRSAFIASFYTPARPFVLERVRFNLMDEAEEIPEDEGVLFDEAVRALQREHQGPGQSGVIAKLMHLAVGAVANLLAAFECPFRIVCDPRERREDEAVRASVTDLMAMMKGFESLPMTDLSDVGRFLRGIETDRLSEEEPGLQLADLMVGEVCAFFKANPELLTYGASRRLVTPDSEEPVNTVTRLGDRLLKTGVLHKMPSGLRNRFLRPDPHGRTVLPLFRDLFAAGILTCYSAFGQPRDLMIFEGRIWDQCE